MQKITYTQRTKWRKRATTIALNSVQNLLTPALNVVISALVVRVASKATWGEFVGWLITAQLIAQVVAWGNKEYLLRHFAQHPHTIPQAHRWAIASRLMLLMGACLLLLMLWEIPLGVRVGLLIWLMALFITQSLDVLVVYRRDFAFAVLVDVTITIGMVAGVMVQGDALSAGGVLIVFIIGAWGRALAYAWRYRPTHVVERGSNAPLARVQKSPLHVMGRGFRGGAESLRHWLGFRGGTGYLRLAMPFFLLGISGMLASRIDLYTLSAIATRDDVAKYQVVINLLLYLQASANFILLPFAKTIYRLDDGAIRKMAMRLFAFGLIAIPPALWGMNWLMLWLYDLHYTGEFWLMAGVFALPIFGYLPIIHRLYGQNAQGYVLWVNIAGAIGNGVLNLLLIPPLGITGALMASAIIQWGMLVAYILRNLR